MLVLGRADMLEPTLELTRLDVKYSSEDHGMPIELPTIDDSEVIICCVHRVDGAELLSICRDLNDMQHEVAWIKKVAYAYGAASFGWYSADFVQSMLAYDNLMNYVQPPFWQ